MTMSVRFCLSHDHFKWDFTAFKMNIISIKTALLTRTLSVTYSVRIKVLLHVWSYDAMVLGKLPVPGRSTILIIVGQGPIALAVGAGGGCLDIFSLSYNPSFLSPSLWETARYRLKYCLKGPLSLKQPTNQRFVKTRRYPLNNSDVI